MNNEQKDQPTSVRQHSRNEMLSAVYVGEQTPLERLKNKLTPFLNLAAILYENEEDSCFPFIENCDKNERLNKLFEKEVEQCKINAADLHKYLSDCEVFYNRR